MIDPDERQPSSLGPNGADGRAASERRLSRAQLQQRAIKGAYWTLLHTVISIPLAFGVNILIARVLGPTDYGRLAYLTTVITITMSVITSGISTGVVQFGAKAHARGDEHTVKELLSTSQAIHMVTIAPIATLVVLSIADVGPTMLTLAIVFGVIIPAVLGSITYCLGIENKTAQGAQNAMLVNLLTQGAVILAVVFVQTADSVWVARLVTGGVGVALALFYVAPAYRKAVIRPRFHRMPPGFWRFAIPAGAAGALSAMISSRMEVVVLTWMSAGDVVGIFALAFGVAGHLFGPAQALVGPLIPAISGLHEVDRGSVQTALLRTLRASSTVLALLLAAAVPLFAFLIPVLYGEAFASASPVLLVLGVSGGLAVIVSPLKAFMMARLSGRTLLLVNVAAVIVDLALMLVLVPFLGLWGAVIGNVAASLTQIIIVMITEARALKVRNSNMLHSILPYAVGTVACALAWFGTGALRLSAVPSAAVAASAGIVIVILLIRLLRVGLTLADVGAVVSALPSWSRRTAQIVLRLCSSPRARD